MAENSQNREIIDRWQCVCFKRHKQISASRPPVVNAEYCSCVDVRSHGNGVGEFLSQPLLRENAGNCCDPEYDHCLQHLRSYASSSIYGPTLDGHEGCEAPELLTANTYLPLGPDLDFDESQRRCSSFVDDMSYQMRRFLGEQDHIENSSPNAKDNISRFLSQDVAIPPTRSPKNETSSRKRSPSKVIRESMHSCGSAHSLRSMRYLEVAAGQWGTGPVPEVGAWYDDGDDASSWNHMASDLVGKHSIFDFNHDADNVLASHTSMKTFSNANQDLAIDDTPVHPSSKGNRYPLPPAWMTRSISEDGLQHSLADQVSTTEKNPRISLVALAKAGIFMRRWIRKKRSPVVDKCFLSASCFDPTLNSTREEQVSVVSNHPDEDHIRLLSTYAYNKEEAILSSYADSVDSLENESTEDSQNDEGTCGQDEFSSCQDLLHVLLPLRDSLPHELFVELGSMLNFWMERWQNLQGNLQHPVQSSEAHHSSGSTPAGIGLKLSTFSGSGQKRASNDRDGSFSPENRGGGNGKRPKIRRESQPGSTGRRWACPYYQREPHRYCLGKWRLCAKSPGFREVHRVKAHIYDRHAAIYCERCYTMFENDEDLLMHRRELLGCNVRSPKPLEGLTKEQKELLRPRDRNKSEEERWNTVYRICFPDDDTIPNPYFVCYSRETAELRREIFEILRQEIPQSERVNRERLLQRVQNAFEGRLNLPVETPDTEPSFSLPDGPTPQTDQLDENLEDPLQGSLQFDPLPLRQAPCVEPIQPELTQDPIFDDFCESSYRDNLPMNELQVGLSEQMPLQLDFSLPSQVDGNFDNGFY